MAEFRQPQDRRDPSIVLKKTHQAFHSFLGIGETRLAIAELRDFIELFPAVNLKEHKEIRFLFLTAIGKDEEMLARTIEESALFLSEFLGNYSAAESVIRTDLFLTIQHWFEKSRFRLRDMLHHRDHNDPVRVAAIYLAEKFIQEYPDPKGNYAIPTFLMEFNKQFNKKGTTSLYQHGMERPPELTH